MLKQRQYAQAEELCTQFSKMGITITEQRFIDEIFNIYGKCLTAQQKDLLAPDKALFALWETLIKSAGPNARRELLAHVFRTSVALGFWETAQMV